MKVLGLDLGTTSFSACLYDNTTNEAYFASQENSSLFVKGLKREFDIRKLRTSFYSFIEFLDEGLELTGIEAISITGNMHSFFLVKNNQPVSNIVSWQDERVLETYKRGLSYLDYINNRFDSLFSRYQFSVSSGYAVSTLFYMINDDDLAVKNSSIHFALDFIIKELMGDIPYDDIIIDHSIAHSSGLYDLMRKDWNLDLIGALGYNNIKFPEIAESGTMIGRVGKGFPHLQNVPVYLGMGDNQASVLGSIIGREDCSKLTGLKEENPLILNIGTSGQISAVVKEIKGESNLLDYRPFIENYYLLVGASLAAGKTMETLKNLIKSFAYNVFNNVLEDEKVYMIIEELIQKESPLQFRTTLNGTRYDPQMRGIIKNIDLDNFTLENIITSAAYGIVEELYQYYQEMNISSGGIVGVGNGLQRNGYFIDIIKELFGNNFQLSSIKEAASFGAAVCSLRSKLYGRLLKA